MASFAISFAHFRLLTLLVLLAPRRGSSKWDTEAAPSNSLPVTRIPLNDLPGSSQAEYHVVVGYGTPAQNLTVGFDTWEGGVTILQCMPCGTACDMPAFDPSLSSSITQVPCGSPDCPLEICSGPSCNGTTMTKTGIVLSSISVVTDTLTLLQTTPITMENIRANCLELGTRSASSASGILALNRDSHSLASRAPLSPDTVAFSYCLPSITATRGFLSVGAPRSEHNVTYTALRTNAALPNTYLVRLAALGLSVDGPEIPIPAGNALFALRSTFTYLKPETYTALREQFKAHMTQYQVAPPLGILDTCYNFTGLSEISMPAVTFRFAGSVTLDLGIRQMMYFQGGDNVFSVGCLAFNAPVLEFPPGVAVMIGTLAQETMEVLYDVRGGKIGFVPNRC